MKLHVVVGPYHMGRPHKLHGFIKFHEKDLKSSCQVGPFFFLLCLSGGEKEICSGLKHCLFGIIIYHHSIRSAKYVNSWW